jgi:hypothetical protein
MYVGTPGGKVQISGAVKSVNGKTGDVVLTAPDVGALPTNGGRITGDVIMDQSLYVDNDIKSAGVTELQELSVLGDTSLNKTEVFDELVVDAQFSVLNDNLVWFGRNRLTGVASPSDDEDAANKAYVDTKLPIAGGTITGDLTINNTTSNSPSIKFTVDPDRTGRELIYAEGGLHLYANNDSDEGIILEESYGSRIFIIGGITIDGGGNDVSIGGNTVFINGVPIYAPITKKNASIAPSAWVADTSQSGFSWRATIAMTGVTLAHSPDVRFVTTDAQSGNFGPANTYAGGVYIYAKTKPTGTITIPAIICQKVV